MIKWVIAGKDTKPRQVGKGVLNIAKTAKQQ